jgi:hypothetical protein
MLLTVLFFYFLPVIVAAMRGHHNVGSIAVINVFLGWTFVGWVVALAMACGAVHPSSLGLPTARIAPEPVTVRMADRWDRWQHRNDLFCGGCGAKKRVEDALYCMDCGGVFLGTKIHRSRSLS